MARISPKKIKSLLQETLKWVCIVAAIAVLFYFRQTQIMAVIAGGLVFSWVLGRATSVLQKSNIGLSFTKLLVMLMMYWYGIKVAIISAAIFQIVEWMGQNYYKPSTLFALPNLMLMPLYGFWILEFNIAWAGFILLNIANVVEIFGSYFIAKEPVKVWMYFITNALFNFPIFWRIAPLLVEVFV